MTCYGRYHRTALDRLPPRIHTYLMRRAQKRVQAATAMQESPHVAEQADRKAATDARPPGLDDRTLSRQCIRRAE